MLRVEWISGGGRRLDVIVAAGMSLIHYLDKEKGRKKKYVVGAA